MRRRWRTRPRVALLAGLLCWLDARSQGAGIGLRLEDLDRERCKPEWARAMVDDLAWLGLDWDWTWSQSDLAADHEAALDRLAEAEMAFRRSRALGRDTPELLYNLGLTRFRLGRQEEGIALIRRAAAAHYAPAEKFMSHLRGRGRKGPGKTLP